MMGLAWWGQTSKKAISELSGTRNCLPVKRDVEDASQASLRAGLAGQLIAGKFQPVEVTQGRHGN